MSIFQRKHACDTHKTFYKFAFISLFMIVCVILVFGTFLSASKLGDSEYDIELDVTTSQPSTTTSIKLVLLVSLV